MQKDKKLKTLLQEYGIEETLSTFNNDVMQTIQATLSAKQIKPLLNIFIIRLLQIVFVIVATLLVVLIFKYQSAINFSTGLKSNIINQLFNFIIVFWIGILMNIGLNKVWNKRFAY